MKEETKTCILLLSCIVLTLSVTMLYNAVQNNREFTVVGIVTEIQEYTPVFGQRYDLTMVTVMNLESDTYGYKLLFHNHDLTIGQAYSINYKCRSYNYGLSLMHTIQSLEVVEYNSNHITLYSGSN